MTLQREDGGDNPVLNNFNYASDMQGLRCPFHAHIRKTNPRGDIRRLLEQVNPETPIEQLEDATKDERRRIMARRGMTYGRRNSVTNPTDRPTGGVGLMFMSFQRSLEDQFEFTQQSWANNEKFVTGIFPRPADEVPPPVGRDPVIGQRGTSGSVPLQVRERWGWPGREPGPGATPAEIAEIAVQNEALVHPVTFEGHVKHRGGEYFFAPALSTLASI